MSGTSLDGLDAALVRVRGSGLALRAELVAMRSCPLGAVGDGLRRLAAQEPMPAGAIARLMRGFAGLHLRLLAPWRRRLDLVCAHGQTVFHAPPDSWQLFQPAPLALGLGVPVVCDLRAADLAAGGQGAPLTPLADWLLLRHARERRVVANLGGFCNLTILPAAGGPESVRGRDLCACNQVLDAVARARLGTTCDRGGRSALGGRADDEATADLVRRLAAQSRSGRSLGTGDELMAWLKIHRRLSGADLARSACAAIATTIAGAVRRCDRLLLAGGSVRNAALLAELRARCSCPVEASDDHGVPAAAREAMAWAVLGALCQDGVPIALRAVTGADRAVLAGSWVFPGGGGTAGGRWEVGGGKATKAEGGRRKAEGHGRGSGS